MKRRGKMDKKILNRNDGKLTRLVVVIINTSYGEFTLFLKCGCWTDYGLLGLLTRIEKQILWLTN